jgi:SAM-dependent methyltransferase
MSILGQVLYRLNEFYNERRLGVKTSGLIMPKMNEYAKGEAFPYLAISYAGLNKVFREIKVKPGKDVFIDFGSGLGRVPLFAAQYPFKKVIGVELAQELHDGAVENLKSAQSKLTCKDVEFVCEDALKYKIPDDASVIYFFMPFGLDLMKQTLENIHQSVLRAPREVQIVYLNPMGKFNIASIADDLPWMQVGERRSLSAHYEITTGLIRPATAKAEASGASTVRSAKKAASRSSPAPGHKPIAA